MKEISCQILDPFFREGRRAKVPPETLAAGTGYELAHLRDKNERIEWNAYRAFVANTRKIWSEEQLIELGGAISRSPVVRALNVIARLLFTPRDFYGWMASAGSGAGNQLVTCIVPRLQDLGPGKLAIELELAEGYEPCPEFFLLALGAFRAMPEVLGLPAAKVTLIQVGRVSRYEIEYPAGGGALAWLRKAVTWPFTARAAARELKDAHEVLRKRYDDLERARAVLAQQATQLRTAHSIGLLVHGDLDLDRTLGAVANAMVTVAGFDAVRLRLAVDVEGSRVERESAFGTIPPAVPTLSLPLEGRAGAIGTIAVWNTSSDPADLLEVVVPTISTVIDDALSYTALLDYRVNLERKVETRTAELREARDALAATVVDLEAARRSRDKIFSNINHEIRTPLSLMTLAVGDLRKLLGDRLEDTGRQRLDGIERGVGKLLRLVDGLLLLAAGQEKKLELRLGRCELSALLDGVVASWAPLAGQNGITLVRLGPAGCVIRADDVQIERAVANLVSNAIKFTPQGGRIEVELQAGTDDVTVLVRDTGVGIDAEFKKRIFGRFEQGAAPLRGGGRGSGIGLSLVKELIEAHGGTVSVDNGPTGGSEFRLQVPGTPEMADPGPGAASRAALPAGQVREAPAVFGNESRGGDVVEILEGPTSKATVLVAEDEPELRRAVGELLREQYRVILAPDGLVALEQASKHMPDILVSDIGMPGMDGLELTRRFRDLPGNRLAPVLLLTAYANLADRLSGFEAGAVDYVCKPFEPEELRARVRSLLALRSMALKLHQTEKLAALGTLAAGLAHEMRNPANAIVNAIEPLREQLPPELVHPDAAVGQLLDVLGECAGQIAILSSQLLGFKRQGLMQREETPIGTVITRALALVQPVIRDLVLHQDLGYKGTFACSPALLTQVLSNLLENAAHAAGAKGWVRLATRLEHENLIIEVSDSGPGVPPELRERIFEPFFTTKPPGKGTGLGLSTARDIVGRHDGTLDVRDAASGSVFRIELPTRRRTGVTATSMAVG